MSETTVPRFDPEWCCWAVGGWEDAYEGSVRDARRFTRSQAHAEFARSAGEPWINVRVWTRYIRPLGRQELYEWWVENRTEGWDDDGPGDDVYPPVVPDGWDEYDATSYEYCPTWQFVHRSHPQAIPVWICGFKGYAPPVVPDA